MASSFIKSLSACKRNSYTSSPGPRTSMVPKTCRPWISGGPPNMTSEPADTLLVLGETAEGTMPPMDDWSKLRGSE